MAKVETLELTIEGNAIHCSGCENRIQGVLGKLPGVARVKADHKTQKVLLTLAQDETPLDDVLAKLEFLGYSIAQRPRTVSTGDVPEGVPAPHRTEKGVTKTRHWDTVCSLCTSGVSVVCMTSMAAALAAAGAAAGAGAAGMAGMGSMSGLGGTSGMGSAPAEPLALPLLPSVLERLSLGFLNTIPNEILQPLLVALLTVSAGAAYLASRGHRRPHALILTVISAVVMYLSIYAWMSDPLYLLSLIGLAGAGLWGMYLARQPGSRRVTFSSDSSQTCSTDRRATRGTVHYSLNLATWKNEQSARALKSAAEIEEAEARGELTIEQPGAVLTMPFLTWPGGRR